MLVMILDFVIVVMMMLILGCLENRVRGQARVSDQSRRHSGHLFKSIAHFPFDEVWPSDSSCGCALDFPSSVGKRIVFIKQNHIGKADLFAHFAGIVEMESDVLRIDDRPIPRG